MKKIFYPIFLVILFLTTFNPSANAAKEKIFFVPHDDRPIDLQQTVEVVEQLKDYEIIVPPQEILSNCLSAGDTDALWENLEENLKDVKAAVISSDSMLYGGLIPSRKHEFTRAKIFANLNRFEKIRQKNPNLKIYVFCSLMRTPTAGTPGDVEEPDYYVQYGGNIFEFSALADKQEVYGLTPGELGAMEYYRRRIPGYVLNDWLDRRTKNLAATKILIDMTQNGTIDYLVIGRDDNSEFGQTHRENRYLKNYLAQKNLTEDNFMTMNGIDEIGLLLLTRAVNELRHETPEIYVRYNVGAGGDTIPAYSDEKISDSVREAAQIAGAKISTVPRKSDFVLLVNTDPEGKTFHDHNPRPGKKNVPADSKKRESTDHFYNLVKYYIGLGYPVGIADISYANGADNALLHLLSKKNLLFKIHAYAGWNTATNTTGFALGAGILSNLMTPASRIKLLYRRYLDDWGYQANVRTILGSDLFRITGQTSDYANLNGRKDFIETRNTDLMNDFARKNLPPFKFAKNFKVTNPWNRMFECRIDFEQ